MAKGRDGNGPTGSTPGRVGGATAVPSFMRGR